MRTFLSTVMVLVILSGQTLAQETVKKVKESKLTIDKLGSVTIHLNEIIGETAKASRSKNKGKWKGIGGKIFGKFYPKGSDEIINVTENKIHKINRKKKKCETRPIVTEESKEGQTSFKDIFKQMKTEQDQYKDLEKEEREKEIEILAQDFIVENLNETVTHYGFTCNKFRITFFQKSRHLKTGVVRLDSASIKTDMTRMTDEIRRAMEIERTFGKNYFEKLGLEFDFMKLNVLGGDFLGKYKQAQKDQDVSFAEHANIAKQIEKLKDFYPIATRGEMYGVILDKGNEKDPEEVSAAGSDQTDVTNLKKKGFGFAKGLFGKKKKDKQTGPIPFLKFSEKVKELRLGNFNAELQPPFKCKEKE